jgi:heat-inducible transcriptional repressor
VQYPSVSQARARHIEFVPLGGRRVLCVLIADTGAVEQRVAETPTEVDEALLAEIRARVNAGVGGLKLSDAAERLRELPDEFSGPARAAAEAVAHVLVDQIESTRQEKLVMAGAANLVRTEHDFTGSIYPVLEAIEEQVELLKLFGEMATDQHGVSVSIGRENASFGLSETSVLASGYAGAGGALAHVGVLGPIRMDYSNNMAAVRAVARYLSRQLGDD